jgi:hypothetical protein
MQLVCCYDTVLPITASNTTCWLKLSAEHVLDTCLAKQLLGLVYLPGTASNPTPRCCCCQLHVLLQASWTSAMAFSMGAGSLFLPLVETHSAVLLLLVLYHPARLLPCGCPGHQPWHPQWELPYPCIHQLRLILLCCSCLCCITLPVCCPADILDISHGILIWGVTQ